ncbi:hypothetical protein V5O48_006919 [Marasmius crinis-equi]|uniref:Uncharacterized protein n=1 Tax=Marasmius crinis-equi TaxID=585013 RepID=A0ABR3FIX5_9AGAR
MSLSNILLKYILADPPENINFDKLDLRTRRAISALEGISEYKDSSYYVWTKAWPWVESLSRSLLDNPPSTFAGKDAVDNFLEIVPSVFLSAIDADHKIDQYERLQNVIRTPRAISTTLELWLYASSINHVFVRLMAGVLKLFLDFRETDTNRERFSLPADCRALCLNSSRWDLPTTCVKEIVRVVCEPQLNCSALRSATFILLMISRDLYPDPMPRLIRAGAVRWLAIAMLKLASPTTYDTGSSKAKGPYADAADCIEHIVRFMSMCASYDTYALIDALDAGVLLSMYRTRVIMHSNDEAERLERYIEPYMIALLTDLNARLLHRAVLVRVIRSVKKAEKLGFYPVSQTRTIENTTPVERNHLLDPFHRAWFALRDEALSRHARVTLHTMPHVARSKSGRCTNDAEDAGQRHIARRSVRKRRGKITSESAKKTGKHYKVRQTPSHKVFHILTNIPTGGFQTRMPSTLEQAFIHSQVYSDCGALSDRFRGLREQYLAEHPNHTGTILIQMDYSHVPVQLEAMSVEEARSKLTWPCGEPRLIPADATAFALVPWRRFPVLPLVVFKRPSHAPSLIRAA